MGLYGKYTRAVNVIAITQMLAGISMVAFGIAFRLLVCSWITDAAFGFWIGILVFFGGIVGHYSTKSDVYGLIGYYLGLNSLGVMLTSMMIFCHAFAWAYFNIQMQLPLTSINSTNHTNISNTNTNTTANASMARNFSASPVSSVLMTSSSVHVLFSSISPTPTANASNMSTPNVSVSSLASSITSSPTRKPNDTSTRSCYTDKTWSDYDNGVRGVRLGAGMIFVCVVEIIAAIVATGYCWAAANVQPTVPGRKVVVQGVYSDVVAKIVKPVVNMALPTDSGQVFEDQSGYVVPVDPGEGPSNSRERQINTYEILPGIAGGGHMTESLLASNIEMKVLRSFKKTEADERETTLGSSSENLPGTSTNDQDPSCSFSYYSSLPPFNLAYLLPPPPPYCDSDSD